MEWSLCLSGGRALLGEEYSGECHLVQSLVEEEMGAVQHDFEPASSTLPSLVSLLDCLVATHPPSPATLQHTASLALRLTDCPTPLAAAPRLLTSLLNHCISSLKAKSPLFEDCPLVTSSTSLVDRLASLLSPLPENKPHLTNLANLSYSLASLLYQAKVLPPCRPLLTSSLTACSSLVSLDPGKVGLARSRLRLQTEVLRGLGEHRAALVSVGRAALVAVREGELVAARLGEAGRSWLVVKVEWLAVGEEEEVHSTSLASLASAGDLGEAGPREVASLVRAEVTWYRGLYTSGTDLTRSWVGAAAGLVRVSKEQEDKGLVLLEQTWVFWLGDNKGDLETGARCAEQAARLLQDQALARGWALYWRFMCEHRLLMLQVSEAAERADQAKVMERKEREGLGQEQPEQEVTPAFPGLELGVQQKLTAILEEAVEGWCTEEMEPSPLLGSRTLCDLLLAVAWEQERLDEGGRRAFLLVAETARRLGEVEHEVMARCELARLGEAGREQVERLLELARGLEQAKITSVAGAQVRCSEKHFPLNIRCFSGRLGAGTATPGAGGGASCQEDIGRVTAGTHGEAQLTEVAPAGGRGQVGGLAAPAEVWGVVGAGGGGESTGGPSTVRAAGPGAGGLEAGCQCGQVVGAGLEESSEPGACPAVARASPLLSTAAMFSPGRRALPYDRGAEGAQVSPQVGAAARPDTLFTSASC